MDKPSSLWQTYTLCPIYSPFTEAAALTMNHSAKTQVSRSECAYAFTTPGFLHEPTKRSVDVLDCHISPTVQPKHGDTEESTCQDLKAAGQGNVSPDNSRREDTLLCKRSDSTSFSGLGSLKTSQSGDEKALHCKQCGKRHQRLHTGEKPVRCTRCEESFDQSDRLRSHQRVHTFDKSFNDLCDKTRRRQVHAGEEQGDAGEEQADQSAVEHHAGGKPLHCTRCYKRFNLRRNLKKHQRIHCTGEKLFDCQQCGKRFDNVRNMRRHQWHVHTAERNFRCEQCDKSFKNVRNMREHQRHVHADERTFHCEQCGKGFNSLGNLKRHRHVHTGERPHHCVQCDESFGEPQNLRRHQTVHTGERPFRCDHCRKGFSSVACLELHQRVHTRENTFLCQECDRSFSFLSNLKRHQKGHSGEKQDVHHVEENIQSNTQ